jgi:hypothetical protein
VPGNEASSPFGSWNNASCDFDFAESDEGTGLDLEARGGFGRGVELELEEVDVGSVRRRVVFEVLESISGEGASFVEVAGW